MNAGRRTGGIGARNPLEITGHVWSNEAYPQKLQSDFPTAGATDYPNLAQ